MWCTTSCVPMGTQNAHSNTERPVVVPHGELSPVALRERRSRSCCVGDGLRRTRVSFDEKVAHVLDRLGRGEGVRRISAHRTQPYEFNIIYLMRSSPCMATMGHPACRVSMPPLPAFVREQRAGTHSVLVCAPLTYRPSLQALQASRQYRVLIVRDAHAEPLVRCLDTLRRLG